MSTRTRQRAYLAASSGVWRRSVACARASYTSSCSNNAMQHKRGITYYSRSQALQIRARASLNEARVQGHNKTFRACALCRCADNCKWIGLCVTDNKPTARTGSATWLPTTHRHHYIRTDRRQLRAVVMNSLRPCLNTLALKKKASALDALGPTRTTLFEETAPQARDWQVTEWIFFYSFFVPVRELREAPRVCGCHEC